MKKILVCIGIAVMLICFKLTMRSSKKWNNLRRL